MKLYYHLPFVTYDYSNSCFEELTYNEALSFFKLIYKNLFTFQKKFLSKIENIPNLQQLCVDLGYGFEEIEPLTITEIENLENEECKRIALGYYNKEYSISNDKEANSKSFFKKYIQKVKEFVDKPENQEILFPYYNSDLLKNKTPHFIKKTNKYTVLEQQEFIHFLIKNVEHVELNNSIRYFICWDCNINKLQLNNDLIFLDATNNKIKEIELNKNLVELDIANNDLKELQCNSKLIYLDVRDNKLENLKLNDELETLIGNKNNLEKIELNPKLKVAYLSDNPLKYIKLSKNLIELNISHPENKFIEVDNSINNETVEIHYTIN